MTKHKILVIEDDKVDYLLIKEKIEKAIDCEIEHITHGKESLKLIQEDLFDCIILDYLLPDYDGLELLKKIKALTDTPILFITGHGEEIIATKAISFGAMNYFSKDKLEDDLFTTCLKDSLKIHNTYEEFSQLREKCKVINKRIEVWQPT